MAILRMDVPSSQYTATRVTRVSYTDLVKDELIVKVFSSSRAEISVLSNIIHQLFIKSV